MSDKPQKPKSPEEKSTIFSEHKSGEAIRQEQKEEQRRERKALVRELTSTSVETRTVTIVMVILLAVIVVGCGLAVFFGNRDNGKEIDPHSEHVLLTDALPELSQEGVKAAVTEAYYTVDGRLMVKLKLGNGLPTPQTVESFSLTLLNGSDEVIASGHQSADWDPTSLTVPANGYAELTLYIPKEDVKIANDSLREIKLEMEITANAEDPEVLKTTTTTTNTTTTTA